MLSFIHTSTTSVDSASMVLPKNAHYKANDAGEPIKGTDGKFTVYSNVKLEVPETMAELASLSEGETYEIKLGDRKVKVPEPVYDYIVGRKLRANQDMQAALRGDGKQALRAAKLFKYLKSGGQEAVDIYTSKLSSLSASDLAKWQDGLPE